MGKTLEQYVQEATSAYQPAYDAVQGQIDALPGQLDQTNQQINTAYNQQRANLNNQRNDAAYSASMQAAGSGGSFGGKANIANRKYYSQAFVPAVTQMNTNHANDLAQARQNNEQQRLALTNQLAQMQAQARQQATQQYWAEQEAERNRELQRQQIAAQNAYNQYAMEAYNEMRNKPNYTLSSTQNMYGGYDWTDANGRAHTVGTVAYNMEDPRYFNDTLWKLLQMASDQGDYYSQQVAKEMQNGARFEYNPNKNSGNSIYDTLGIRRTN